MVSKRGVQFQLGRIRNTFLPMLRNRMALVGFILLVGFIVMALGAPLLTPYGPTQTVSGRLAEPGWVINFRDGYFLSENVQVGQDPLFNSPAALQYWSMSASSSTAPVLFSYAPGVSSALGSHGSAEITYRGSAPVNVTLSRTFQFPYNGPPAQFQAFADYMTEGANATNPVSVSLFIVREGSPAFTLYSSTTTNSTFNGTWQPPAGTLISGDNDATRRQLGMLDVPFKPQSIIFSARGGYTYGIQITFTGPQKVFLDNFQLVLFGTAWGLAGTDNQGADVFSQVVYGSRVSLLVGLLAAGIGIGLGLLVGLMAGFLGRILDEVLMRFTDMMLVIPALPLLIVLASVFGANIWILIIIIGFLGWMGFARVIRSQVLTLRERPFVEASRAAGAGTWRIMTRHIFPNIVSLTYVNLALSVPAAILTEAALAFLGLSDATVVSWGNIFNHVQTAGAFTSANVAWWWFLPPGISIALISLSFVLIGYSLDEIFNPRLRRRR